MAIPFQKVRYQIMGGMDSKIDGVVLPAPRLQVAENVYSDKTGSLRRRFGRSALTTQTMAGVDAGAPVALAEYQNRLLAFGDDNTAYEYGSEATRWVDRGRALSYRIRSKPLPSSNVNGIVGAATAPTADMAILGDYRCYAYDYLYKDSAGTQHSVLALTLDDRSGTRYASEKVLVTTTAPLGQSSVKVVAFGVRFYVVYCDMVTGTDLKCFIIDTTSATTITSSLAAAATTLDTILANSALDLTVSATYGPLVVYRTTTASQLKWGFVSTAGALTNTSTNAGLGDANSVTADCTGAGTFGFAYYVGTNPNDVYALIRTWNGSAWSVTATSTALDTALTGNPATITCNFIPGTTTLRVWYVTMITTYAGIRQGTLTSAGVQTSRTGLIPRSFFVSRPFTGGSNDELCWVFSEPALGTAQPTLYLLRHDGVLVAWANQGTAVFSLFSGIAGPPHVSSDVVGNFGDTSYAFLTHHFVRIQATPVGGFVFGYGNGTSTALGEVIVDLSHQDSFVGVEDGQCLYMPHGFLQQFDGSAFTELGFLSFVDMTNRTSLTPSNGAGSLTVAATYSYQIVMEWTNAKGEREQGTNNGSKTVTMGGADDTVTIGIDSLPWTRKRSPLPNLVFAIYRTQANPTADSPFYRLATVENDPTADRLTYVDLTGDGTLIAGTEFFRDASELDPVAPPPGHIIAAGNGRVFIAGLPDDPNTVWYSKQRSHGLPLEFNDALQISIPQSTGDITALCVMNEALFVFTERSIYRVTGDGVNNVGFGAFSQPQVIVTDTGAMGPRAVKLTPLGILFIDQDLKVNLLSPSGGVEYIGAQLENVAVVPVRLQGIVVLPELQQIRISYSSTTHVYDYYHRQWYVWTHASDGPTCSWNGVNAALDGVNVVYDSPAVWTDAGDQYAVDIQLGWQSLPESLQSNLRFQWVGLVGTALAAARLTVDFYHDFNSTTLSQSQAETISGAGVLRYQWRPNKQVADALMVRIHDGFLDVYGEYIPQDTAGFRLNEVVFVIGLRERPLRRID